MVYPNSTEEETDMVSKFVSKGHTARKWENRDLNPKLQAPLCLHECEHWSAQASSREDRGKVMGPRVCPVSLSKSGGKNHD